MGIRCRIYRFFIDPLLHNLRRELVRLIDDEASILEVGSGTGIQSRLLASPHRDILAVEINPEMAECAREKAQRLGLDRLEYFEADARDLNQVRDQQFDAGLITLALHEMDQASRKQVISELKRCSKEIFVVDYKAPLPRTVAGLFVTLIEKLAGSEHYAGFLDYQNRGGLTTLFRKLGLNVSQESSAAAGTVVIYRLIHADDTPDSSSQ
jgi:ubiquinone/menaquinone biosynthesis C-methylase UbiE